MDLGLLLLGLGGYGVYQAENKLWAIPATALGIIILIIMALLILVFITGSDGRGRVALLGFWGMVAEGQHDRAHCYQNAKMEE